MIPQEKKILGQKIFFLLALNFTLKMHQLLLSANYLAVDLTNNRSKTMFVHASRTLQGSSYVLAKTQSWSYAASES